MQAKFCWALTGQPKGVVPGAVYRLPLAAGPLPSVPQSLRHSLLRQPPGSGVHALWWIGLAMPLAALNLGQLSVVGHAPATPGSLVSYQ